jgi:hypothetical protein
MLHAKYNYYLLNYSEIGSKFTVCKRWEPGSSLYDGIINCIEIKKLSTWRNFLVAVAFLKGER